MNILPSGRTSNCSNKRFYKILEVQANTLLRSLLLTLLFTVKYENPIESNDTTPPPGKTINLQE